MEHLRAAEKQLNKVSWWLELTTGRVAPGKGSKADQQVCWQQHCCFPCLTCFTAPVAGVLPH